MKRAPCAVGADGGEERSDSVRPGGARGHAAVDLLSRHVLPAPVQPASGPHAAHRRQRRLYAGSPQRVHPGRPSLSNSAHSRLATPPWSRLVQLRIGLVYGVRYASTLWLACSASH
jgi:hypothetical protein